MRPWWVDCRVLGIPVTEQPRRIASDSYELISAPGHVPLIWLVFLTHERNRLLSRIKIMRTPSPTQYGSADTYQTTLPIYKKGTLVIAVSLPLG